MSTLTTRVVAIVAPVATLPPFLFFSWSLLWSIFDPNASIDGRWLDFFMYWAFCGFLIGGFGCLWLALTQNKTLWLLLLLPSVADGFYAVASAISAGLAQMH